MAIQLPILDTENLQVCGGRVQGGADANAFGGQVADSLNHLAAGLGAGAEAAQHIDDRFTEANATELDNTLNARLRTRLYDPQTGYLSTARGRNAIEQQPQVEADIDGMVNDVASQAANPRAAEMFRRVARNRADTALGQVFTHAADQTRSYQNEQTQGRIDEATNNAVAAYGDHAVVGANIATGVGEIRTLAQREGWSPEITDDHIRQFQSDVNSRVIVNLATTDPAQAQSYYDSIRPSLTAQDAGQLLTTMRAAQSQYVDRIEGMGWQAFANGQPLSSMDPNAYHELLNNPLLGQAHARLVEAQRVRAQSYTTGTRVRDNSPAYIALQLEAANHPDEFMRPGALETFLTAHAGEISANDMSNAISMRTRMATSGNNANDPGSQNATYNALHGVAGAALAPQGLLLNLPADSRDSAGLARQRAFEASLLRETQRWYGEHNGAPVGEDIQTVIGRAVVGMHDANLGNLPAFRVAGDRGRDPSASRGWFGGNAGAPAVRPSTEAVVPIDQIPEGDRNQLIHVLHQRLRRNPTIGETENAYAAYLQNIPLDQVLRAPSAAPPPASAPR